MNGELNFSSVNAYVVVRTNPHVKFCEQNLLVFKLIKIISRQKLLCRNSMNSIKTNVSGFSKSNSYILILIAFYYQIFFLLFVF